ncbi:MAG: hypothetical protein SHS37scaffold220_47 [Phage 67_12]|nr:MAG: hypothetical protein SHS37scaffold220_47 [Phage 67_12]
MDGPTIQARVYAGYAKAARVIGIAYDQFRPLSAGAPLGNKVATVLMALDSGRTFSFNSPNEYGDPTWLALINDATVQTGDYLVGNNGGINTNTYFIAGKQFLLPVLAIECNRLLRITRENGVSAVGAVAYSGKLPTTETDVLGGPGALWPASILQGGRKEAAAALPAGVKNAGWKILLPPSVPVVIIAGDIVTDDLGRRYAIDSAELTDLGWRINANEVHS